ncbi:unnamed protein product, partial [Prorocentrum cordatum]
GVAWLGARGVSREDPSLKRPIEESQHVKRSTKLPRAEEAVEPRSEGANGKRQIEATEQGQRVDLGNKRPRVESQVAPAEPRSEGGSREARAAGVAAARVPGTPAAAPGAPAGAPAGAGSAPGTPAGAGAARAAAFQRSGGGAAAAPRGGKQQKVKVVTPVQRAKNAKGDQGDPEKEVHPAEAWAWANSSAFLGGIESALNAVVKSAGARPIYSRLFSEDIEVLKKQSEKSAGNAFEDDIQSFSATVEPLTKKLVSEMRLLLRQQS